MDSNFDPVIQPAPGIYATQQPVVIATHNGSFHADDVFGIAVLQLVYPNSEIVRTRDPAKISMANFAVDVGGVWDAQLGRFDHHQKGFAGARPNGVVYASAGLVWAAYAEHCISPWAKYLNAQNIADVIQSIDEELVQHLDRADTGAAMGAPGLFGLSALVSQFNPTWLEENCLSPEDKEALKLERFKEAVDVTKKMLVHIITDKVAEAAATNLIRNSQQLHDGRVLLLGGSGMPWVNVVVKEMPSVLFVVYPDSSDTQYQVRTVPVEPESFVARADLPAAWAGLRDADLAAATGVPDAAFCHNGRFIGGAYSLDGALRMAELALAELAKARA
jgi:uncharacterized UPF0160 family protein